MLKMAHILLERVEGAKKLPMNSLDEFVGAMNCDSTENSDASLSLILYHCILVKEVIPEFKLPS